ncbi:class I SAM-dependent methyltransferase [Tepidiforma sp.]|uniref:class I SAM-dependent methyltransferase n=1 Tax=Tepidiforma sp. TaxID=2682230 RepID=UPI002ADE8783|nr:methyltransferase domain-containing protein [Tepidiforma sp.]
MHADGYGEDAAFYDAIHDGFRDDIGLWLAYAGRTVRPVLEVGCGTGRIAVELAAAGHEVTGIDPSPAMLARARRRAEERGVAVHFIEGRALELKLETERYGLVLLPLDVFLYCRDGEEQRGTLAALAGALAFDGVLALDLPGPAQWLDPATNGQPLLAFSGVTDEGLRFECWHVHEDDLAEQTRRLRVAYDVIGDDGLLRRRVSEHLLRYVGRWELEYLLEAAGLELVDLFGDYDAGPLTGSSERMIAIARRLTG